MTERISKTIIRVSIATLLASFVLILGVLYEHFTAVQFTQQRDQLTLVAQGVNQNGLSYLEALPTLHYRITLIEPNGTVAYDSRAAVEQMENHGEREECTEALAKGYGEATRYSHTLSEKTIYTAARLKNGSVLRLSVNQLTVLSLVLAMLQPLLIVGVLGTILSILLAKRVAERAVAPINRLDLDHPLAESVYPELTPLLHRLERQNHKIHRQMADLQRKNDEILFVTNHVSDGIVMLDREGKILSANPPAKALLGCREDGYYLDRFRELSYQELIEAALAGGHSTATLRIGEKSYRFSASGSQEQNAPAAVFLVITDCTEEENALRLRREFTANVSHELKTPLASILGSAEIIANGIAAPADVPHFAQKIGEEAARLLQLIRDILKLSQLDEGRLAETAVPVSLETLANETIERLAARAKSREVSLTVTGQGGTVQGYPPILSEMVYNLCDNAISYNRPGGTVTLTLAETAEQAVLTVADTGIGIPAEHLPRIFERFYRVDKSHSKASGGTGLGLAIVKHGAMLHRAAVSIESTPDVGTAIRLEFPRYEPVEPKEKPSE